MTKKEVEERIIEAVSEHLTSEEKEFWKELCEKGENDMEKICSILNAEIERVIAEGEKLLEEFRAFRKRVEEMLKIS
ncbi:MAG: hypothetical protein QXG39_07130 [Candidatus Aenigmatarchaeota archaeon]